MNAVLKRLTYANVIATLALFLALGGGVVWAAGKVGAGRIKPNSVSAGKIKRNAVTAAKIRPNAVTAPKIRPGAVDFAKLAAGTNVIATAHGGPVPANNEAAVAVPLTGTVTFTPTPGSVDFLSIELKGENLAPLPPSEFCSPIATPVVNGSVFQLSGAGLRVQAFPPTAEDPTGLVPVSAGTAPLGLTSPGVTQTIGVRVNGDEDCLPGSAVSVAIAVTQAK
jgi:hypothetical protein